MERRITKRGTIEFCENALPCQVIDVSEAGAGLALPDANHIPNFFTLVMPDRAPVFCQSVWRQKERMGVTFRELRLL
jgi:hypothetical protein